MQTLAENRRARFDYDVLETFDAGIALSGHETKSVKNGRASLSGSYAIVRGGEAWLINSAIEPYQPNNVPENYEPTRSRRLLLTKKEIATLSGQLHEKGLLLIPLEFFLKTNLVKVRLGLARSRKKKDKRELLKKRSAEREMRQIK